ncbi:YitT family protein [Anaerolineales bacterium]
MRNKLNVIIGPYGLRSLIIQYAMMTVAALISAVAVNIFLAPFNIAPGGVSGLAVILHKVIGTPIGLMILIMNIPIQILAYKMLPNPYQVIFRTIYVLVVYSIGIDGLAGFLPAGGVSDNVLLNAIFGGVLEGISSGLIYRAGGTFGGTSTLSLILRLRFSMPQSTTVLYTDTLVIGLAGFVFGWEPALFAVVTLFVGALAVDYVMEGPAVIRTGVIITNKPEEVAKAIIDNLGRGVSGWPAKGMYTGQERWMLYVSVGRSQVRDLQRLINETDKEAFMVIGQGHQAYGHGFRSLRH